MIISRLLSINLRFAQFVFAAVVLVLASHLLHQLDRSDHSGHSHHASYSLQSDCHGRLIYSIILAVTSLITSLIWLFPTTSHVTNFVGDGLFCGAWFAAFGLLQEYYAGAMACGSIWAWDEMTVRNGMCSKWNAAQAFSFLGAVFWFVSFALGLWVWRRAGRKRDGAGGV